MGAEESFDLDAAGLRADAPELGASLEALAVRLQGALPDATRVRRSRRLLGGGRVAAIEVDLGDARYTLTADGAEVVGRREQEVRGVVIRRQELALADWIDALATDLRGLARTSAQARAALERLLG